MSLTITTVCHATLQDEQTPQDVICEADPFTAEGDSFRHHTVTKTSEPSSHVLLLRGFQLQIL